MGDDEKRSGTDRRANKERRSGTDTRSEEEKRLTGERRSQNDRRSDQIANLLARGWIETNEDKSAYRLTDRGLAAKMAPVRTYG